VEEREQRSEVYESRSGAISIWWEDFSSGSFFFFLGLGAVVRFVSFALQLCGIQYQRRLKEERGRLLFFGFGPGRRAAVEEELAGCASTWSSILSSTEFLWKRTTCWKVFSLSNNLHFRDSGKLPDSFGTREWQFLLNLELRGVAREEVRLVNWGGGGGGGGSSYTVCKSVDDEQPVYAVYFALGCIVKNLQFTLF
jgi:hypothetical protein